LLFTMVIQVITSILHEIIRLTMMRYFFSAFLLLLAASSIHGQSERKFEKPDYATIERLTKDISAAAYYPKLFSRYQHNDTTLTDRDFMLLYYGYFFQSGYKQSGVRSAIEDSVNAINNKGSGMTTYEMKRMIRLTQRELKRSPFDLEYINALCNMQQMLGNNDSLIIYLYKLKMIARTLCASGDGLTEPTAIHVLMVSDEYSILHLLGFDFDGIKSRTAGYCDYLKVKKNNDGIDGFYFDVSEIQAMQHKTGKAGEKSQKGLTGKR